MTRIAALVLAGGRGSRFGGETGVSKAAALLAGKPMISHVVACTTASGVGDIVIVTGHGAASLPDWPQGVAAVHNAEFADGLASSLRVGLAAIDLAVDAVLVLLADMPLVAPATLIALRHRFGQGDIDAVVPTFRGEWGNPVLIGRGLFPDLMRLKGDGGARFLLRQPGRSVAELPVDDPMVLVDVDTPAVLARLETEFD